MHLLVDDRAVFAGTGGVPFDAARRAVVFLHGAGMDHTVWQFPARHFAHRRPAVLVPDLMAAAAADRREASDLVAAWGHGGIGRMGGNPAPGLWLMEGARRLLDGAGRQVLATDLAACAGFDASELAGRVHCPTLVLVG